MRLKFLLAALAAFLFAGPAAADITARYSQSDAPPFTVQVADNGDSRSVMTHAVYLTTDGVTYLVIDDPRPGYVVRLDVFTALMNEVPPPSTMPTEPAGTRATIDELGTETIAGRTGRVFRISMVGNPSETIELVICTDADLASLGRALERHFAPIVAAVGRNSPALSRALVELLGRGTLLRFAHLWRLESLDMAPIPPATFALPSAPIGRDELIRRLGLRSQR